jgi:hypothetical protein
MSVKGLKDFELLPIREFVIGIWGIHISCNLNVHQRLG